MRKRLLGVFALGAATAAVLSGCAGGSDDSGGSGTDFSGTASGTLSAWAFNNADDVGQARLDYAASQLSGVTINRDDTAFDAQKFTTRVASGEVPDVVQMDRGLVVQYAAQGLIQPLDACFSAKSIDPKKTWYPFVIDDVTYQSKVWAVPQFYQPPAIMVNMNVLNQAGSHPDQIDTSKPDVLLAAIAKMYQESGGVPTRLGFDPVSTGQTGLWILSQGGKLTDADGKPTLDDSSNVAGIDLLKKINDAQGGFAKVKSFTDAFDSFGDNNQFVANQVGAQIDAQWYPNVVSKYVTAGKADIRAVPFLDNSGKPFSVAGGTAFVIPTGAKNPAAACAWATAITNMDSWMAAASARVATLAKSSAINTGLFTGSPDADQKIRSDNVKTSGNANFDEVISTYYDVLDYGKAFGASPAGGTINTELANAVTAVLNGQKSADQALKDAQAAALRAYQSATQSQ